MNQASSSRKWFQKTAIQAAFVAGAFSLVAAMIMRKPEVGQVSVDHPRQIDSDIRDGSLEQSDAVAGTKEPVPQHASRSGDIPVRTTNHRPVKRMEGMTSGGVLGNGRAMVIREGESFEVTGLGAFMTLNFRETLGSSYAEITIARPDQPSVRFPVRSPGADRTFLVGASHCQASVLAIDWQQRNVQIFMHCSL